MTDGTFKFSFYPNSTGNITFPSSIHPGPRDKKRDARKRANHVLNHQARAAINSERASSTSTKPTFHGGGRHAGVPGR